MISIRKNQPTSKEHIGMIRYCSYWRKYCLILNVDPDGIVAELDGFGDVYHGNTHTVRYHRTHLSYGDKLYTIDEFYQLIKPK